MLANVLAKELAKIAPERQETSYFIGKSRICMNGLGGDGGIQ